MCGGLVFGMEDIGLWMICLGKVELVYGEY